MRSVMRFGARVQKPLKCAICHVRVGNLHDPICPRRERTPMTVEYSDATPSGVSAADREAYEKKGGI